MTVTLTTAAKCLKRAGANVSTTITADTTTIEDWINDAESEIGCITRKDWVTAYSGLTTNKKLLLKKVCECLVAIDIINYDLNGVAQIAEAETRMDVLTNTALRGLSILRDSKQKEYQGV